MKAFGYDTTERDTLKQHFEDYYAEIGGILLLILFGTIVLQTMMSIKYLLVGVAAGVLLLLVAVLGGMEVWKLHKFRTAKQYIADLQQNPRPAVQDVLNEELERRAAEGEIKLEQPYNERQQALMNEFVDDACMHLQLGNIRNEEGLKLFYAAVSNDARQTATQIIAASTP